MTAEHEERAHKLAMKEEKLAFEIAVARLNRRIINGEIDDALYESELMRINQEHRTNVAQMKVTS